MAVVECGYQLAVAIEIATNIWKFVCRGK